MTQPTAYYLVMSASPEQRMIPASSPPLARTYQSVAHHDPVSKLSIHQAYRLQRRRKRVSSQRGILAQ
jgi:hypothetical protein